MKKNLILTLWCGLLMVQIALAKPKIHHFCVIQSHATSNVSERYTFTQKDRDDMKQLIYGAATSTAMDIVQHHYERGQIASWADFQQKLARVQVDADDVIVFCYHGHGSTEDGYPKFYANNGDNVSLTSIHAILQQKHPRLLISYMDACNIGSVSRSPTSPPYVRRTPAFSQQQRENLARLFRQSSGDLKMCASQTGTFAHATENYGGIFTYSFVSAFVQSISNANAATWQDVFQRTKSNTERFARELNTTQTPKAEMNVRINNRTLLLSE